LTGLFADRLAPLAVVVHTGRVTGAELRTPVIAYPAAGSTWVIPLTYGSETDWVKNVMARGGCDLVRSKRLLRLVKPRLVAVADVSDAIPSTTKAILGTINVSQALMLTEAT
jgi:deazaflavin-dependent oxidoreductase (nitroreductase family)